ncbi:MAG: DUF4258 domain-containing protein [Candidatus Korarchaeota archaeon]|nr:DUF4258 domain-containing protein [Candidatus Korarchaeota archaeon]NIU85711.1 DUF4258 domain-containing protein [Candidatus Thorarchaeota archaeon]NIW14937.1 DUF4258 domain-containing protein [Candidatus Thorarchaeota archaeon]NIW52977.1 DUF4258 domain-containing protein [Candidatus Korarchaeota archaeon]
MKLVYTDHAAEKIVERGISKKRIAKAVKNPDAIRKGKFGRKIIHKDIKGKLLRIIVSKENDTYRIITVYYTSPERYVT